MALSELEIARYAKAFETFRKKHGPPPEMRSELDWGYKLEDQSLELYETRPLWNDPSKSTNTPFAKATFVKSTKTWKIYWMRASGKWNSYQPCPEVKSIDDFFQVLAEDTHQCFLG